MRLTWWIPRCCIEEAVGICFRYSEQAAPEAYLLCLRLAIGHFARMGDALFVISRIDHAHSKLGHTVHKLR